MNAETKNDFDWIVWRKNFSYAVVWSTGYTCHKSEKVALKKSDSLKNHPHVVINKQGSILKEIK